jgi:hypothetical protein
MEASSSPDFTARRVLLFAGLAVVIAIVVYVAQLLIAGDASLAVSGGVGGGVAAASVFAMTRTLRRL